MDELGWEALHNRHLVVERGGDRLVVAGVDDAHRRRLRPAAATAPTTRPRSPAPTRTLPVLLLAHQPKQIAGAVAHGRRPAALRAHPRRPDLAVPLPGPPRPAGAAGPEPARRAHPALHQPRHRLLGPAVPGLRAERDHPADPPTTALSGRHDRPSSRTSRPRQAVPRAVVSNTRGSLAALQVMNPAVPETNSAQVMPWVLLELQVWAECSRIDR